MRGQASAEYMIILAVFLVIFASVTVSQIYNPAKNTAQEVNSVSLARSACDSIANAMNGVASSGDDAVDSLGVTFSDRGTLKIDRENLSLKIGVHEGGSTTWVESGLVYAFENEQEFSSGRYTVIVEKGDGEGLLITDNRIFINLDPGVGEGQWR